MPDLRRARYFTNACYLNGTLYVFGGRIGQKFKTINSIEMLNLSDFEKGNAGWDFFQPPEYSPLEPRFSSLFGPINSEELVIIGGRNRKAEDLNDIILYNVKTRKLKQISDAGLFKFYAGKV
jgi:hypothetical protein